MKLINNKGTSAKEEINEFILLYDFEWVNYIHLFGFGSLLYYYDYDYDYNEDFIFLEEGLNIDYNLSSTSVSINLHIQKNTLFETYLFLDEEEIDDNFILLDNLNFSSFKFSENLFLLFFSPSEAQIKVVVKNRLFNEKEETYLTNSNSHKICGDLFYKNRDISIKSFGLIFIFKIKLLSRENRKLL